MEGTEVDSESILITELLCFTCLLSSLHIHAKQFMMTESIDMTKLELGTIKIANEMIGAVLGAIGSEYADQLGHSRLWKTVSVMPPFRGQVL